MSRTDAVLAAIDGALLYDDISVDAMRWSPNPPPRLIVIDPAAVARDMEAFRAALDGVARGLAEIVPAVCRASVEMRRLWAGLLPDLVRPVRRVELAGQRRVASRMRIVQRRAARRRR